jgi:hypothetical protein
MSQDSLRSIVCWIGKEDHLVLQSILNLYSNSRQNALMSGELLMFGVLAFLAEREGEDELSAEAQLRLLEWETRRRLANQALLNAIAARANITLDEEEADLLHILAEELDLDEAAAAQLAEGGTFASAVAYSYNGTKGGQCMQWLASLLSKDDEGIPRAQIAQAGARLGYSESMINRSSRKLNVIKKKGEGGVWRWYPPEEREAEQHMVNPF